MEILSFFFFFFSFINLFMYFSLLFEIPRSLKRRQTDNSCFLYFKIFLPKNKQIQQLQAGTMGISRVYYGPVTRTQDTQRRRPIKRQPVILRPTILHSGIAWSSGRPCWAASLRRSLITTCSRQSASRSNGWRIRNLPPVLQGWRHSQSKTRKGIILYDRGVYSRYRLNSALVPSCHTEIDNSHAQGGQRSREECRWLHEQPGVYHRLGKTYPDVLIIFLVLNPRFDHFCLLVGEARAMIPDAIKLVEL